jgi:NSS family neurotransmitter:Na+ symporter
MYYIAILGWVLGMWWKALIGSLWTPTAPVPAFVMQHLPNPMGSFFNLISGWDNVLFVLIVWLLNVLMVVKGTRTIEAGVKIMMPLMWIFMIALVVRGLTLEGGLHGIYMLFTPDFSIIQSPMVWQGAFSQVFFTLTLGFGVMTAYASYMPKKSDHTTNALLVSSMDCAFSMIAGLAVFALLFSFSLSPKASTLSMMFFIVPSGISQLPIGVQFFGVLFFTLLLMAGLSSSISLIESLGGALIDKFRWPRTYTIIGISVVGILGSIACALPVVIDKGLDSNGTLGLTILDLIDHYAFTYGLLLVGLLECLLIGWMLPVKKLRESLNANSKIQLGRWFDVLIKYVIPVVLFVLIVSSIYTQITAKSPSNQKVGIYGHDFALGTYAYLPIAVLIFWLSFTLIGSWVLASRKDKEVIS